MGHVDRLPDPAGAGDPAAGHLQVVEVDDPAAAAGAADEGDPDEVQGRPAAPAAGDDEVLPGELGQPVRLLPPDGRAAAGVPVALLHAAHRPAARHLPGRQPDRDRAPGGLREHPGVELPLHPRPDRPRDGLGADRADRALRRVAARLDAADVGDRGPEPAPDLPRAPVLLRRRDLAVPGRSARLLDYDEPVDDRAAVDHQEAPRAAARTGDGCGQGGQGGAGRAQGQGWQRQGQGGWQGRWCAPCARQVVEAARARDRERQGEGRRRYAPGTAAQEEEALGAAPMSASAAERVRELLEQVNEALALDATVEIEQPEDGVIRATLHADDLGLFIGRHGATIDAVQHLAYRIAAAADDGPQRVIVDAAGYRERREQALHRQADEAAEGAVRSGRPVALDAMSATERKVVHEHLKDREDVETYSEGTEPDRHLVVAPLD